MPARLAQALEDLDTSRDGEIDAAEWEAAIETALANKLKTLGELREAKLMGGGTGLPLFLFGDLSGLNGAGLQRSSSKKKKVSGAGARLCAAIEDERNKCDGEPLVLFTGNSFGSSFEGTVTKGDHLVPTLNSLGTYAGGVGAKDLEFGVQNLERLAASLNFPLLLSNVVDARTGEPLKGTQASRIVHWSGRKVGLMAVASEASLAITGTVECVSGTGYAPGKGFSTQVRVEPEARSIQRVGAELRQKGAEVIICLAAIGGGHGPGDRGAVLAQGGGADVVIVSGPPGPRGGALGATKYEVGNGRSSWCVRAPTNLSWKNAIPWNHRANEVCDQTERTEYSMSARRAPRHVLTWEEHEAEEAARFAAAGITIIPPPPPAASKEPEGDCVITGSRSAKARDAELMRDAITVAESDAEQEGAPPKRIPFLPRNAPAPRDDSTSETSPSPSPVAADPCQAFADKFEALQDKSTKDDAKIAEQAKTIAKLQKQVRKYRAEAKVHWPEETHAKAKAYDRMVASYEQREAKRARAE